MKYDKLKLPIEIVPESSHNKNLRYILSKKQWEQLRKIILTPLDNKCEICGSSSPNRGLDLHEVWDYNIKTAEQKLIRLEGLCIYCHEVKHYFLANMRGNYDRARNRLQSINNFTNKEVQEYEQFIINSFKENSKIINWNLNIDLINQLI